MNRPRRIISLVLTAAIMLTATVFAVAADKETDLKDLKNIISITGYNAE